MKSRLDEHYMKMALKEARKGLGRTSPNPCVGAVIVKEGRVIGKGFHKRAGTPHAEINAMNNAVESVDGATIYVTLEPCNHTGKTPPCSRALARAGFSRVVVGMTDPNPMVNGSGIDYLKGQGIEVTSGLLEQQCTAINFPFIKHISKGLPWTIMKAGVSLDGRLNYQHGFSGWITGEESQLEVHRIRDRVDAILVGRATVVVDNPSLTTRLKRGKGKDPARIILDSDLSTPLCSKVYNLESEAPTRVACAMDVPERKMEKFRDHGIELIAVKRLTAGLDLHELLAVLGKADICSVLVEGGAHVHGTFLREKLFDYAHLFYAPVFAGDQGISLVEGYQVPIRGMAPRLTHVSHKRLGDDILVSGQLQYS